VAGPCADQHRGGSGEPLVCIHGIGSTWQVWSPILPALEARHDVLAVSLPGYGDSPPLDREPSIPALVDAVEAELDAADLEAPHLVGNSLGGYIAADLARRGRARSVVAISPFGLWTQAELDYGVRSLAASHAIARAIVPVAEEITRSALGRTLLFAGVTARPWRLDPDAAAHALRAFANSSSFLDTLGWIERTRPMPEELPSIRCAFRAVWGTWDFLLPPRQGPRWTRLVPGADLRLLTRLGHVPMSDDPDAVAREVLDLTARASRTEKAAASA
jgi:pimeloyl-ACP methyl ester carboxylesterase